MSITKMKITLTDGSKYTLKSRKELKEIDSSRLAIFVFNNGEVYNGYTDGEVDYDGDFCLKKPTASHAIGLPFGRLLGWAYKKQNRGG